jgi:hypothetical protein
VQALPDEIREIVTLHWGFDGSAGHPVHEVARQLGRTPAEVRAVIRNALNVLRDRITAAFPGQGIAAVRGAGRLPRGPWGCVSSNGRFSAPSGWQEPREG